MARIVMGSYMFRYPLGGMMSWVMQYLQGLRASGHDVYFIERASEENACYDPGQNRSSDNAEYALRVCGSFLDGHGMKDRWCFLSYDHCYYGMTKAALQEVLTTADIYIDMGAHGTWAAETEKVPVKVLIEGEPGFTQIRIAEKAEQNVEQIRYDHYFTNGQNIGDDTCVVPTLGIKWHHLYHPVHLEYFSFEGQPSPASVTSIMNWQSHKDVEYKGKEYGQKDREFVHFIDLPGSIDLPMELALGKGGGVRTQDVPWDLLRQNGWGIVNNREVTASFEHFRDYIYRSYAEFRVCKHLHVEMKTGWFSDVTACYMASGRPAVVQDTGYPAHLPTGRGLCSFQNKAEAVEALNEIKGNYRMHSKAAREIATEYFDAKKLMRSFTDRIS